MPQAVWSRLATGLLLMGLGACSDESRGATGGGPVGSGGLLGSDGQPLPAGSVDCSADPRLDEYVGLDKPGELGLLSFHLAEVDPAPPAKGSNTFRLQLSDASGVSVAGDLRVDLRMPDHGHGTSVKPRIAFDPASGQFTVESLFLFMPGVWRIQLEAYAGGAAPAVPIDRTALFFCIQG
jgi:YtkA-like